jgi:arginine-glutamic acid dipeptide repeat-containing protein
MFNVIAASATAGYPRPSLLPPREATLGLHHPSDILGRGGPGYADQLAHQV